MAHHGRLRRSAAHVIAPLALIACAAAVVGLVTTYTSDEDDGGGSQRTETAAGQRTTPDTDETTPSQRRRFYRVKLNDTLGLIAEKTGVPVERLQELNPELDPQNLIVGQRVKLRE
jgi:LysM repeat protein